MDWLNKRLEKLDGELEKVATDIRDLYDNLHAEKLTPKKKLLEDQIQGLVAREDKLLARSKALEEKLQPRGVPQMAGRQARENRSLTGANFRLYDE